MFIQMISMKRIAVTLFVAVVMSSSSMGASFELAPVSDIVAMTWTSPGNGTITISGDAWATGGSPGGSDTIKVLYVPSAYASTITSPAGPPGIADATPLLGGTVPPNNIPYPFPTYNMLNWNTSIPSLPSLPGVAKGDVIVLELANQYTLGVMNVGASLNVGFAGNLQGQGGSLSNPQLVTSPVSGISGSLNPSAGHSTDVIKFSWAGGDFSGTSATDYIFGSGTGASAFASGLGLDLYSSSTLIASTILLDSSGSGSFDLGNLAQGNYVLQLTDLNSGDDPPYDIQFNGQIGAPLNSSVPEPSLPSLLLFGSGVFGLVGVLHRKSLMV